VPKLVHLLLLAGPGFGQGLQLELRTIATLGDQAVDQGGAPFTVTGLSGLDVDAEGGAWAVLDHGGHLVRLTFSLGAEGDLNSAAVGAGLSLADQADFEGLALAPGGSLWLSDEDGPGVRRYEPSSGARLETLPVPAVFSARRPNRGFESLALGCGMRSLWTANEEALTVDGPASSPNATTVVRLLRYDMTGAAPVAAEQYAYEVEPMHGPFFGDGSGQNGLVDLVALPGGRLLSLERSAALTSPIMLSRVFELDLSVATDVSGLPALDNATYTPVGKTLLWQGPAANLEGLCLGPQLTGGGRALLGVVDDGDPFSVNALVSFRLTGLAPGACVCAPAIYCSTSPNSVGPGARLDWSGSTSLAANDLVLRANAGPPGVPGLLIHGPLRADLPLGDGRLCVGGPLLRSGVLQLDAAGTVRFKLDLAGIGVLVGESRCFQLWYRDPGFGAAGFNLSDGLEVRFCP
jgi:Esterase-like activity of phytase